MKIIVELSGALVLAAIKKDGRFHGKKVGAIISGGNIDLSMLFNSLRAGLWKHDSHLHFNINFTNLRNNDAMI